MSAPEKMPDWKSPRQLVQALQEQIARLEKGRRGEALVVSSGCPPLDRLLPDRGFRRGTLVEWFSDGDGTGAGTLALLAARQACADGGVLVVLDTERQFYPPAAARGGLSWQQLIVVQAATAADHLWAIDQALRCPAVAAVLGWPPPLDGHTFRRLQLAAEQGGVLGLLLRPASVLGEPSWAEVRLRVEPLPSGQPTSRMAGVAGLPLLKAARADEPPMPPTGRRLRIELLRSRGASESTWVEVEIDDETDAVRLVASLAAPATHWGRQG